MTDEELIDLVKAVSGSSGASVSIVLVQPDGSSRLRFAIEHASDLVVAAATILGAVEPRLQARAAVCPSCRAQAEGVDRALTALGLDVAARRNTATPGLARLH